MSNQDDLMEVLNESLDANKRVFDDAIAANMDAMRLALASLKSAEPVATLTPAPPTKKKRRTKAQIEADKLAKEKQDEEDSATIAEVLGDAPPPPPAAPKPPVEKEPETIEVKVMTPAANGATYESYVGAGWSDAQMIDGGLMVIERQLVGSGTTPPPPAPTTFQNPPTIDEMRLKMIEITGQIGGTLVTQIIQEFGSRIEEVSPDMYNMLLSRFQAEVAKVG